MEIGELELLDKAELIHLLEGLQYEGDIGVKLANWMRAQIEQGSPCLQCMEIARKLGVAPQKRRIA